MPHNVASDQGLHCLLTRFSIKNRIKVENRPNTPKMINRHIQHITVEESISKHWVKALNTCTHLKGDLWSYGLFNNISVILK